MLIDILYGAYHSSVLRAFLLVFFAVAAVMSLGGCVTKSNPAHTEVYYPGVGKVDYHCPPGQRKKGRC